VSGYVRGPGVQHWHSISTITDGLVAPQNATSSTVTWPTANLAIYVPVIVRARVVVKQLWFANQTTASGNYDIGLYDAGGTGLLRKGSAAKPSGSDEVVWDCTDTTIGPGIYFLALAMSVNTDTLYGNNTPSPPNFAAMGLFSEASALPLPATATFAVPQTLAVYPIIGMFLDTRTT
jgi:hypothetical protein